MAICPVHARLLTCMPFTYDRTFVPSYVPARWGHALVESFPIPRSGEPIALRVAGLAFRTVASQIIIVVTLVDHLPPFRAVCRSDLAGSEGRLTFLNLR